MRFFVIALFLLLLIGCEATCTTNGTTQICTQSSPIVLGVANKVGEVIFSVLVIFAAVASITVLVFISYTIFETVKEKLANRTRKFRPNQCKKCIEYDSNVPCDRRQVCYAGNNGRWADFKGETNRKCKDFKENL